MFLLPQLRLFMHGRMNVTVDNFTVCFLSLTASWIPLKISMDDKYEQRLCMSLAVIHLIQSYGPWCFATLTGEWNMFVFFFVLQNKFLVSNWRKVPLSLAYVWIRYHLLPTFYSQLDEVLSERRHELRNQHQQELTKLSNEHSTQLRKLRDEYSEKVHFIYCTSLYIL